jgi:phosphatidylserine/phosphatidylglycerophosphate/cardiolipin synthase-like enzyme
LSVPSKFVLLLLYVGVAASRMPGQTNPAAFNLADGSYSFTTWPSTSPAGTYPPNMRFHRGPSQDPGLTSEPNADYTLAYNLSSGTRMNGLGADGFSWRNIGSGSPPGDLGAAVLALNTTGVSNVRVSWTGGTVDIQNERQYRIRLQYRVGASGSFVDVPGPIEYTSSTIGDSKTFGPTLLPSAVNNQPVIQLRWKYYYVTGSGNRPQLRVGNIFVEASQGANSGDGTGRASIHPDTLSGGITGPIQIVYRRDTSFTVAALRILVPSAFAWSHDTSDVSATNVTADKAVAGDTLTLTNISFGADSTVITISSITSPDTTGIYTFKVQSKENSYLDVSPLPRVVVFGSPLPIADMRASDANGVPFNLGQLITVRGIVTVANQLNASFIQDNTAGMAVFGSSFSSAVQVGDEVIVSGIVQPFNGLFEIVNPLLHSIVSTGNPVVPLLVTASQIANDGQGGVEQYEGLLVRMNAVSVSGSGLWGSNQNYPLSDPTGTTQIRIQASTNLVGQPIPAGAFDLICVVGQFKTAPPYIGGYQVMPRFSQDVLSTGPIIATLPIETDIQQNGLTIYWQTIHDGSSYVRYGVTPSFEMGVVGNSTPTTSHTVQLGGLSPATVYYLQAFSVAEQETSSAAPLISSTASPSSSTGQINAYFNKDVYTAIATVQPALGNENLVNRLVARINNSRRSIDAALYSLSGTPGNTVASALVNAKNRGVKVRVICEEDNRNTAAFNTIANNSIPLITDKFDPINNGAGLHHNKFIVIDARGGAAESTWVWTGSWNPTQSGTDEDFQNSIEVQDVSLAKAYMMEFNEMWGSDTDVPNASNSRFGARKLDNTPHRFVIAGRWVECYFSPSDRTTSHIISTISGAQHSVAFSMLSFTRSDVANAIIARHSAGMKTRGAVDNNTDQGAQYNYLVANNIDVRLKTGVASSVLLHHKYAVLDAENTSWSGVTITGSHNWSNAAENSNNENTLIIYDPNLANQYLQEFAARYYQFGGIDSILVTAVEDKPVQIPVSYKLLQNYPNPFNPSTTIEYFIPKQSRVELRIFDVLGREVAVLVDEIQEPGKYRAVYDGRKFSSGVYFYRVKAGSFSDVKKMILLR